MQLEDISIHALHEESDHLATVNRRIDIISIHALHEESDPGSTVRPTMPANFNPRSP